MMSKGKLADMQAQGQKCIAKAREIADAAKAADRDMSPSELADYNAEVAAAGDWLKQIRSAKDDLAVIDKAREIGEAFGGMPGSPLGGTPGASKDRSRRLTFAGMAGTLARGSHPTARRH